MYVTVYGANTRRTRIPISRSSKGLKVYSTEIMFDSIPGLYYVVGWVFGEMFSSVTGYVVNNVFFGSIFVDNEIYYVDPYRVRLSPSMGPSSWGSPSEVV